MFAEKGFVFRYFPKLAEYACTNKVKRINGYGFIDSKIKDEYKVLNSALLTYLDNNESEIVYPSLLYWSDEFDNQNTEESATLKASTITLTNDLLEEFLHLSSSIELPYVEDEYNIFANGNMFQATPQKIKEEHEKKIKKFANAFQKFIDEGLYTLDELMSEIKAQIKFVNTVIINKDCRIILPNYGNKEVLPKNALSRAFYILYLRHP